MSSGTRAGMRGSGAVWRDGVAALQPDSPVANDLAQV